MPRSLIGHCFAPLGTNRVLVAGGYSIEDGDYTKGVDIYDFDTGQWFTKPWMPLANGPRIDASCANVWLRGKQRIVIAGGWNNMDMRDTEYFDPLSNTWTSMGRNVSGTFQPALPIGLRSSGIISLDSIAWLIGGATCQGYVKLIFF